jgi:hypothetical protein
VANTQIIDQMLADGSFFPSKAELDEVKKWVVFNMKDWLTAHLEPFFQFRQTVR